MDQNNNNNYNSFAMNSNPQEVTVSGVEKITKKKKGKKIAIISGVSAAVVAGGGVAAYNFSPFVKNQVKLRTMSPKKYLAWVNEENADEFAKSVGDAYGEYLKKYKNGSSASAAIEYEVSDDAKDALLTELYGSDYEDYDDEEVETAIKIMNNINKIKLGVDSSLKRNTVAYSIHADLNDDDLISLDFVGDYSAMELFARIPQLTEQYIGINFEKMLYDELDRDGKEVLDRIRDVLDDPEYYLSPKDVEKEVRKYVGAWNSALSKVKVEKSEEVSIGDIDVKYTVATVKLSNRVLEDIAESFVDKFIDDKFIRELVVDKLEIVDEDEYDEFIEELEDSIEEFKEDLDEDDDPNEVKAIYRTYIDPKGTIRGIVLEDPEDSENQAGFLMGKKGDKIRGELFVNSSDGEGFNIELSAKEKNKKTSGTIEITYNDGDNYEYYDYDEDDWVTSSGEPTVVTIEFDDFKVVNEKKHYIQGDFTVIIPDIDPISISFDSNGKEQRISYDIVIDDTDYGTVSLIYSSDDSYNADTPSMDDAFEIKNFDDLEDIDFSRYVGEKDLRKFASDILKKLGFDKEEINDMLDDLTDELY